MAARPDVIPAAACFSCFGCGLITRDRGSDFPAIDGGLTELPAAVTIHHRLFFNDRDGVNTSSPSGSGVQGSVPSVVLSGGDPESARLKDRRGAFSRLVCLTKPSPPIGPRPPWLKGAFVCDECSTLP